MAAKILIVEDETKIAELVRLWLEQAGYACATATSGLEALQTFFYTRPNLVILDLALPQMDGWMVCERIRELSDVPIMMLTAKTDEADKVRGFSLGADDYVTKPFSFPELVARVQALLRRANRPSTGELTGVVKIYTHADLMLDTENHQATLHGRELKLTRTEFKLLSFMMQHAGQLLSHNQILEAVWGPTYRDEVDSLRMYIRNLRRKLEDDHSDHHYIETEHGMGYRFVKTSLRRE
jgi:DNA-binding response OmpR family regulator